MKLMKHCTNAVAIIVALVLSSTIVLAQDDGPRKRQNVEYIEITYVSYKPHRLNEARAIIADHFIPASQKAGTPGPKSVIHFQTGEWNVAFIWALEDGMADLEWTMVSPNFVKWKAALDELAGGEDEGSAIIDSYNATIARRQTEVGHHHLPAMD